MDLFSTPQARRGPQSRLLKRQSLLLGSQPTTPASPAANAALNTSIFAPAPAAELSVLGDLNRSSAAGEVTQLYTYKSTASAKTATGDAAFELGATENLFVDFLATCSTSASGESDRNAVVDETLDHVAEFEQLLGDHILSLKRAFEKGRSVLDGARSGVKVKENLVEERNTWRLVGKLFSDRLRAYDNNDEMAVESRGVLRSEKRLVERLFSREGRLREAQAVVNWLEENARDYLEDVVKNSDMFGDAMLGWENTLHLLQTTEEGGDSRRRNIVSTLDPDARVREGRRLHELDEKDEARLTKVLFYCIRCGMLDAAQDLCVRLGVQWRAATLGGWKLFHDPNYEVEANSDNKLPVEGNPNRDVWKRSAWIISEEENLPAQERAIYSALCGNAQQIIRSGVCNTYEDILWTMTRAMVDVLVEEEIRSTLPKTYAEMPQKYWDNLKDIGSILKAVRSSDSQKAREEMNTVYHRIQTYIILEDWDTLFDSAAEWAAQADDPHLLRFLSHIILVLDKLGIDGPDNKREVVQEAYIRFLMRTNRVQQVAWYTGRLKSEEKQIELYSEFMQSVENDSDRRFVLEMASDNNLQQEQLRLNTVQAVVGDHSSDKEDIKISVLDWLLLYPEMPEAAVVQSNALVRYLIASQKMDDAKQALGKIKSMSKSELEIRDIVREHYALSAYLDAKDSFADWFKYFHQGRPTKPSITIQGESFTQKIAQEQREKQYNIDVDRWHGAVLVQSREVCSRLNGVLAFPGGWLRPDEEAAVADEQRRTEMEYLRRTCLVETVFLLHTVLHNTRQYKEALEISNMVASEVYSEFSKDDMKKLLDLLRDSSLAAMEEAGSDAFGYSKGGS